MFVRTFLTHSSTCLFILIISVELKCFQTRGASFTSLSLVLWWRFTSFSILTSSSEKCCLGFCHQFFLLFEFFFLTLWRWKCSHYRTSWRSRSPFGDQVKPSTLCIPVLEAKKSFVFFPITSFLSSHLCEILIKKNIFHYHLCFLEVEPLWNQLICKMGVCLVWSASGLLKTPVCCKFFTHVSL